MQRPTARNSVLLKQYKLYLDENIAKDLPPLPNGLTIVEAISDYLRAFHEHVVTELRKGFAKNYGQHQFRYVSDKYYIFTFFYTCIHSMYYSSV
jgi:hypothetical protein